MSLIHPLDRRSRRPLFRQIVERVSALVDAGRLAPETRLPATRVLADRLEVNRSTVYRAYQELWALGYLQSRPGAYTTIRRRRKIAPHPDGTLPGLIPWDRRMSAAGRRLGDNFRKKAAADARKNEPAGTIDFVPLAPDPRLLPVDEFRKCMANVLAEQGADLLGYGDPRGYGPLRESIAARMLHHGMALGPEQVLLTAGAQQAIDLVIALLTEPGDRVIVESPTYSRAIDLMRLRGLRLDAVPMDAGGMDLAALAKRLERRPPAMVYTIPNFHNPTGITTGQAHREQLLSICQRLGVPLVEDGFEEEMKYLGKAVLPIKSMDRHGVVIYLGTFSKVLFPGLRTGWIAAEPACIDRLAPLQRAALLSGSLPDQAALDRFCRRGHFERHLRRIHRVYRRRMRAALHSLGRHLPEGRVRWTQPRGGYTLWLRLPEGGPDETGVTRRLARSGVRVLAGGTHFAHPPRATFIRLSIAQTDEAQIETGIRRLGRGLAAIMARGRAKKDQPLPEGRKR